MARFVGQALDPIREWRMRGEQVLRVARLLVLQVLQRVPQAAARVTGERREITALLVGGVFRLGIEASEQCLGDLLDAEVERLLHLRIDVGDVAVIAFQDAEADGQPTALTAAEETFPLHQKERAYEAPGLHAIAPAAL